jgi:hypothetical protein
MVSHTGSHPNGTRADRDQTHGKVASSAAEVGKGYDVKIEKSYRSRIRFTVDKKTGRNQMTLVSELPSLFRKFVHGRPGIQITKKIN